MGRGYAPVQTVNQAGHKRRKKKEKSVRQGGLTAAAKCKKPRKHRRFKKEGWKRFRGKGTEKWVQITIGPQTTKSVD